MSEILGVKTTAYTEIASYRSLGIHVATNANSDSQAMFLAGLAEAMADMQIPYLADDIAKIGARDAIYGFLVALIESIEARP